MSDIFNHRPRAKGRCEWCRDSLRSTDKTVVRRGMAFHAECASNDPLVLS